MSLHLRTKLLIGFVAVALVGGVLTIPAGSFLIKNMVIAEAQRRVTLGLKTARAMLDVQQQDARKSSSIVADCVARQRTVRGNGISEEILERLRVTGGYDFLHIVNTEGTIIHTARGSARGLSVADSAIVQAALKQGRALAGICLVPQQQLAAESAALSDDAYVPVVATPHAQPGGPTEIRQGLVIEAAAPIVEAGGEVVGAVRVGKLLNRNFALVDFIRDNIFRDIEYKGKNLGTVTIFLGDTRIATNVTGPTGERAIGTRVSLEVYQQVLGRGEMWIGPAFVVDSWYMSAYEPISDPRGEPIGILYVGILKERYDDMRWQAMGIFLGIALVALITAAVVGTFLSGRLARPLVDLTNATAAVSGGNLDYRLPAPPRAKQDEIGRLIVAFNDMVAALKQRGEALQRSHRQLEATADELKRWNQNYLDALEFITHELKNQVAALKLNLLALRDGYVGQLAADQRETLDDVLATVNRTEEMILNYLNLSRIEKGELQVRARPVQVEADVVRPVLRDLRARFEEKQMRVQVDLADDLVVQADPSLLQIVYENLLANAAKYGRREGLVRLWGRTVNAVVELHVWNEGPGVAPEQVDELFRKFTRLYPPGEQERGTGLGLFITREVLRKHGGDIRAESEPGQWVDFVFTLPRPDTLREDRIG